MPVKPLTPTEATREIKRIVQLSDRGMGEVRYTEEAKADAVAPRNWAHDVADDEVYNCLRRGRVRLEPTYNQTYDEWTYSVEFAYDTCDLLTVTAIISDQNILRVITRYKKHKRYDSTKPKARQTRK